MRLQFAANLNFLFTEGSPNLMEKMRRARLAGFHAIEIPYPGREQVDAIRALQSEIGLEVSLMNIALGNSELAFGAASIPGSEEIFAKQLKETIECAKVLNCKKIHIMAGIKPLNANTADHFKTYIKNLKYASDSLIYENLLGVIEPISKYAVPGYFMDSYDIAIDVMSQIDSPGLKVMVDFFHLQLICGNITNTIKKLKPMIGHIQIAQVPHRHEPNVAGELNFPYVFKLIEEIGYTDWIGCEYKPKNTTLVGLEWLSTFDLKL